MPTVTNHDILGHLSWGGNARQEAFSSKDSDNGYGVNALLFGGANCQGSNASVIAEEHDYATPHQFVSSNSYYGYHPVPVPVPAVTRETTASDCSMDTSENSLPFGIHPNPGAGDGMNACQAAWGTNPTRKRNYEPDQEMEHTTKRTRQDNIEEMSTMAQAEGFGLHTPCFGAQSQTRAQTFDLPNHQLPGSTSQMMEAVTPRPRCLMGYFI